MSAFRAIPVAVLFSISLSSNIYASDVVFSDRYMGCVAQADVAEEEVNQCSLVELALLDKNLDVVYKALSEHLGEERKKALLSAQRLWTKFRDANCAVAVTADQEERGKMEKLVCLIVMTMNRTTELKDYLWAEGVAFDGSYD